MDTSDPEIIFDENGYCNHCNHYINFISKQPYHGEKTDIILNDLIANIKTKSKK